MTPNYFTNEKQNINNNQKIETNIIALDPYISNFSSGSFLLITFKAKLFCLID